MYLTDALCDQCDAPVKAKYIVNLASGKFLTFCGHHLAVNRFALQEQGAEWIECESINV